MKLPTTLLRAIECEKWEKGEYNNKIVSLLGGFDIDLNHDIVYYGMEQIISESKFFHNVMNNDKETIEMFVGKFSKCSVDRTIDPSQVMLIADFGLGSDQPIALDYRNNVNLPEIWILIWDTNNYWTKVSSSFDNFIQGER